MKLKEITHCRLAMFAASGVITQAVLTGKRRNVGPTSAASLPPPARAGRAACWHGGSPRRFRRSIATMEWAGSHTFIIGEVFRFAVVVEVERAQQPHRHRGRFLAPHFVWERARHAAQLATSPISRSRSTSPGSGEPSGSCASTVAKSSRTICCSALPSEASGRAASVASGGGGGRRRGGASSPAGSDGRVPASIKGAGGSLAVDGAGSGTRGAGGLRSADCQRLDSSASITRGMPSLSRSSYPPSAARCRPRRIRSRGRDTTRCGSRAAPRRSRTSSVGARRTAAAPPRSRRRSPSKRRTPRRSWHRSPVEDEHEPFAREQAAALLVAAHRGGYTRRGRLGVALQPELSAAT